METRRGAYLFECTRCGGCCRWSGHVLLTDEDIAGLARALGLSEHAFIQRYTGLASNRRELTLLDREDGGCILLDGDRCSVYEARPAQCRRFPFAWTTPEECPGLRPAGPGRT